jgi:hypothetical protein
MDVIKRIGLWCAVAVLSIICLVLYVDNGRTKTCLGGYMTRDAAATAARAGVADTERNFFKVVLTTITDPKSTAQERATKIQEYIALLNKDDQIRRENPSLPVPTECD